MVADQPDPAVAVAVAVAAAAVSGGEGGHAVAVGGDGALAGAERIAGARQHPVGEAGGQIEQAARVGQQRPVPARRPGGAGAAREQGAQRPGEGDPAGGEQAASGHGHGQLPAVLEG